MVKWFKRRAGGSTPTIRDTLFGDMTMTAWSSSAAQGEPWTSFRMATRLLEDRRADEAKRVLHGIVDTSGLESRHFYD